MSKTIVRPTLSLGNHIYLYRLLRDAIGCGKQTFMTQVEEALAAGDMTAYDLGFESTRELLEELNDCIKLTVFKGGRLYATVIANDAWDAALAKGEDKPKAAKGAKQSYKKKKRGEKDLKAVRPKHVKRPKPETMVEAAPEPEPEAEIEVAIEVTAETEIAATTDSEVISEQDATAELNEAPKPTTEEAADQPETPAFQNSDVFDNEAEDDTLRAGHGIDYARGKKSKRLDLDHTLVGYELTAGERPDHLVLMLDTHADNEGSMRPEILLSAADVLLQGLTPGVDAPIVSTGMQDLVTICSYDVERQNQACEDDEGRLVSPIPVRTCGFAPHTR